MRHRAACERMIQRILERGIAACFNELDGERLDFTHPKIILDHRARGDTRHREPDESLGITRKTRGCFTALALQNGDLSKVGSPLYS